MAAARKAEAFRFFGRDAVTEVLGGVTSQRTGREFLEQVVFDAAAG